MRVQCLILILTPKLEASLIDIRVTWSIFDCCRSASAKSCTSSQCICTKHLWPQFRKSCYGLLQSPHADSVIHGKQGMCKSWELAWDEVRVATLGAAARHISTARRDEREKAREHQHTDKKQTRPPAFIQMWARAPCTRLSPYRSGQGSNLTFSTGHNIISLSLSLVSYHCPMSSPLRAKNTRKISENKWEQSLGVHFKEACWKGELDRTQSSSICAQFWHLQSSRLKGTALCISPKLLHSHI